MANKKTTIKTNEDIQANPEKGKKKKEDEVA